MPVFRQSDTPTHLRINTILPSRAATGFTVTQSWNKDGSDWCWHQKHHLELATAGLSIRSAQRKSHMIWFHCLSRLGTVHCVMREFVLCQQTLTNSTTCNEKSIYWTFIYLNRLKSFFMLLLYGLRPTLHLLSNTNPQRDNTKSFLRPPIEDKQSLYNSS